MSVLSTPLFTRTLTSADSPFSLIEKNGITKYTLEVKTGTCEIIGTAELNGLVSNAVELAEGQVFTDTSDGACEVTITIPDGSQVKIIASQT